MVLDASDTGDIFGGDAQGRPFLLRSDNAPEVHDAVRDHNVRFITIYPSLLAQIC